MDNALTPETIRRRAFEARVSINQVLLKAGVSGSTLWRWVQKPDAKPNPVTVGKIEDALAYFEAERAQ